MKPVIKYQGGKTKEIPIIKELAPSQFEKIVEPFCGGAAVSLYYNYPSVLNDINKDVVNLYQVIADDNLYPDLQVKIDTIKGLGHDDLQNEYYSAREAINQPWECSDKLQRALSYVVVRQLCFSGMERYNANGEFNVPFGHYKKFSCNLSPDHHEFMKKASITNLDAITVIDAANESDFIFLDPPYIDRLGYTTGDGGNDLHERLVSALKSTKSKWLFIHTDCEFYRDNLRDFNIKTKQFTYSQIFGKNKNHSGAKVEHIYVTNYDH